MRAIRPRASALSTPGHRQAPTPSWAGRGGVGKRVGFAPAGSALAQVSPPCSALAQSLTWPAGKAGTWARHISAPPPPTLPRAPQAVVMGTKPRLIFLVTLR